MRMRRTLGSLISAALVATPLALISTAAPASAATTVKTRVVMQLSQAKARYGDKISVTGQVQGQTTSGSWQQVEFDSGSARLQFLARGGHSWKTLRTDSYGDSFYFYPVTARGNGTYRVVFSGGSDYDGPTFAASSASKTSTVQRKLTTRNLSGRKAGFRGSLKPAARTKITVLKKHGHKYKRFKTVRTNRKGRFTVVLPAPRRGKFHWKIVFAGNRQFVASTIKGYTYRR